MVGMWTVSMLFDKSCLLPHLGDRRGGEGVEEAPAFKSSLVNRGLRSTIRLSLGFLLPCPGGCKVSRAMIKSAELRLVMSGAARAPKNGMG